MGFAVSQPEDQDFEAAYQYALEACMSTIHISFLWNALRPDTNSWGPARIELLNIADIYFPLFNTKMELQIQVTNTVTDEMPAELLDLPYDHPLVISQFKRTLDTIFAHIPNSRLASLNIGNESDVLWGADEIKYQQFATFLAAVKPYAQGLYMGTQGDTLSVGTTFTWNGLTHPVIGPLCQQTNTVGDHISVTYYGIDNDFHVRPPTDVISDLNALITLYPGSKPVRFAEIGYPTSAVCNSSEQLQSEFVQAMFTAWDEHADRIDYLGYFLTTDWDQATVDTLGVYYGITNPPFLEYLRTLGLRTNPGGGTNKLAYNTLLCELDARNFCNATCTTSFPTNTTSTVIGIIPNPASERIRIVTTTVEKGRDVVFYSIAGQAVLQVPFAIELDVTGLPRGIYFVQVGLATPIKIVLQ